MEAVMIQVCQVEHASVLAPLVAALAREEGTEPVADRQLTAIIAQLIKSSASDFLLATLDGQPVGCVQIAWHWSTWHGAPYAYLEDVYVVPALRGRGIGRRMLLTATSEAEARGADKIMLDVRMENNRAQRLYERIGFDTTSSMLMKRAVRRHTLDEQH